MSYIGYNGFLLFLPVFDMFEYEIGNVQIIIESQSGWRPNEEENEFRTKFWGSWKPYFCCSSLITEKSYFVPAKARLGVPQKKHMKKIY